LASNDPYLGPGGSSGAKPPKGPAQKRVGSYRAPTVLPSGALFSDPGGATTIGTRSRYTIPVVPRQSVPNDSERWALARSIQQRRNERDRRAAYERWKASQAPIITDEQRAYRERLATGLTPEAPPTISRFGVPKPPESRVDDELPFVTNPSSYHFVGPAGNLLPIFRSQAVRQPMEARRASDQRARDKEREDNASWKQTAASWRARFPGQAEQINQIIAIERMPETTLEERQAKQLAFSRVNAKGEVASWLRYLSQGSWSRAEGRMQGIDTMLQRDRFAKSYAFIEDSEQFGLSQQDVADMIASGIITYGKTEDKAYKVPVATVNQNAFERFLDDNFTTDASGKYQRKANALMLSEQFKTLAAGSANIYDLNAQRGEPRTFQNPRAAGRDMIDIPRLGNDEPDYFSMATDYAQDQQTYEVLRSKIDDKIRDEGGGALLDRIYAGKFDAQDVQNLKKYMYSFDGGPYVQAQERWIDEEILGVKPAEWADQAVGKRDAENLTALVQANQKERQKAREDEAKLSASTAEANFRYVDEATGQYVNVRPIDEWPRALAAVLDSGVGGVVPRDVLNQIFFEDVMSGKRRELSPEDKRLLYVAALEAANAGAPVDPFILKMVEDYGSEISPSEIAEEMVAREGDQRSWFGRTVSTALGTAIVGPPFGPGRVIAGLGLALEDDTTVREGVAEAFKMSPAEFGRTFTVGRVANMMTDPNGPLSPTKTDTVFSAAFLDNAIKSPIRMALGFPMGMYMAITDPKGTTTAILKDYGQRYGAIWGDPDSNFIESSLEDPWAPALDIVGLVPVVGFAAKAAQAARIASVVRKVNVPAEDISPFSIGFAGMGKGALQGRGYKYDVSLDSNSPFYDPDAPNVSPLAGEDLGPRYGSVRADGLRRLQAKASGKPVRVVSAWKFAEAQRRALTGDAQAHARLVQLAPDGYAGLNSAYTPHLMDKVASWFTPRYTAFSYRDVLPDSTPDDARALNEVIAREAAAKGIAPEQILEIEAHGGPLRRRAGSPIARGFQDLTFALQKGIAKKKPNSVVVNMPLVGFNFRYVNALKSNPYGSMDLLQRELHRQVMFQSMIKSYNFSEAEQLAVMNAASGGMFSPNNLLAISLARLEKMRKNKVGEDDDVLILTQKEADLLSNPEFLKAYEKAHAELYDLSDNGGPVTMRGREMRAAADEFRKKQELMRHRAGIELDAPSARELSLRYQLFFNAARLLPEDLLKELENHRGEILTDRIGILNGGYHFLETGKFDDIPGGDGMNLRAAMRELDDPDDLLYKDIMERVRASVDYLSRDTAFRTMDKVPMIVVDRVETIAGRKFVVGRTLRVRGEFTKSDEATNRVGSIVDDRELLLPAEAFVKTKSNRGGKNADLGNGEYIATYNPLKNAKDKGVDLGMTELEEQLNRASLNFAMRLFPDARDFTDKVNIRTMMDEKETFEQAVNRNIVASSGLMSFQLDIQFAAMRNAAYRRFKQDLEETLVENAILITREQAEKFPGAYRALRTMKVFDTRESAVDYLTTERVGGEILEYTVNGQKKYVTKMSFIDTVSFALKESREQRIIDADEWQQAVYANLNEIEYNNADKLIMVVPRGVADGLEESYRRSRVLAHKFMRGYTTVFKLFALSMNPRFVTQQFFGTMVLMMMMNPMQAGHIMARFLQYSLNKRNRAMATNKWREGIEVNPYANHGDDYDIIMNRFIREMEDQIYGEDAMEVLNRKFGGRAGARVRKTAAFGYTLGMAIEKNFRVAIIRENAMVYPGFKDFMNNSPDVAKRALEGIPEMGYTTVSKFHAAMDLMSDPRNKKHYDPLFLRELRHSADMVSGNYRDFTNFERTIRDYAIPFYAWSRHSALYTKRMVQERPLTANVLANIGNYGYEQVALSGGLPDWLLESVPMPEVVAEVLGLDPEKDNRLGMGLINPFGTTGNTIEMLAGLGRGGSFSTGSGIFDVTNPLVEALVEQSMGRSLLTGAPVDPERGLGEALYDNFTSLPPLRIIQGLYKTSAELNELRGMSDPEAILKDPYDPNSKLNIPKPKFSTKFPTLSPAGLVSSSVIPIYSLDPEQLGKAVSREYKERGVLFEEFKLNDQRKQLKTANALRNWAYKRDFIFNVWIPAFGNSNPELTARVLQQLEKEKPSIPKGFNPASVEAILSGRLG